MALSLRLGSRIPALRTHSKSLIARPPFGSRDYGQQLASNDDFWRWARNPDCNEVTSTALDDMRAFFERRVELAESVPALMSHVTGKISLWQMANLLAVGITSFPSEHERVLDLIDDMESSAWSFARGNGQREFIYLSQDLRDPLDHVYLFRYYPGCACRYMNVCSFRARRALRHLRDDDSAYELGTVMHFVVETLEYTKKDCRHGDDLIDYDVDLPGCANVLQIAGDQIYRVRNQPDAFCRAMPTKFNEYNGPTELWHGKPGFSPERWGFWKQRITEIEKRSSINEQTRRVAEETIETMTSIEARAEEQPRFDPRFEADNPSMDHLPLVSAETHRSLAATRELAARKATIKELDASLRSIAGGHAKTAKLIARLNAFAEFGKATK